MTLLTTTQNGIFRIITSYQHRHLNQTLPDRTIVSRRSQGKCTSLLTHGPNRSFNQHLSPSDFHSHKTSKAHLLCPILETHLFLTTFAFLAIPTHHTLQHSCLLLALS